MRANEKLLGLVVGVLLALPIGFGLGANYVRQRIFEELAKSPQEVLDQLAKAHPEWARVELSCYDRQGLPRTWRFVWPTVP